MSGEQQWKAHHRKYQQRINRQLEQRLETLQGAPEKLKHAMAYSLLNGGKRIRPFLIYSFGEMLGLPQTQLDNCAVAIECIHSYSLVHDDLPAMDDDDLRRGKATCHIEFDEATAILVGDALQSLAFNVLTDDQSVDPSIRLNWVKILSDAAGANGMCGGQALDMDATNQTIKRSQLEHLHRLKTGALIEATGALVAALAVQITEFDRQQIQGYCQHLGLAFQVQDDILDVIGNTDDLGKVQGADEYHNKSTYPKLMGLENAQHLAQQLNLQATSALKQLPYNSDILCDFAQYIVARNH